MLAVVCMMAAGSVAWADSFGTFDIDFVTISGSTNPTSGYGIVNNDYRMGTYEITNAQFAKFAANNPYWTGADVPSNRVSWFEAAQFVNYLNTSTGNAAAYKFNGSTFAVWDVTDTGYDASNPYRNSNAKYFMPTENEWVKAAYWNGTALQTYANASAGDLVGGLPDPAKWNYSPSVGFEPWNATSGVKELNNTYNMMGNVWEWMESPYYTGNYLSGSNRAFRGGSYYDYVSDNFLASSIRYNYGGNPYYEDFHIGFRVASIVPEPCTLLLLVLGGMLIKKR
jgi:formylglycine-generating enzyme required for sulfatase activity